MKEKHYCPYCGSQMAGTGYCDACESEMLPQDCLTEKQIHNWAKLPQDGILWAFLSGSATTGVVCTLLFVAMADKSWLTVMFGACIGTLSCAIVAFIGWAVIRRMFGRLAARPLDRLAEASFYSAGALGFWPVLALLMAGL